MKTRHEIQTLYRLGASQKNLCPIYKEHFSPSQIKRICYKLTRDLRDDRILRLWEEGKTCEDISDITNISVNIIRGVTKGIKGGRWKRVYNCKYCGQEFKQKRYVAGSFCRPECKRRSMSLTHSGTKKVKRNEEIRKLRAEGLTYESIGNQYNLSRQRVHAIVHLDREEV